MHDYGKIFRELRQQRQISLKQISDKEVSISQISRFERGESDITLSKLLHLLNKIKVIPSEFFHRINSYESYHQISLINQMRQLVFDEDWKTFELVLLSLKDEINTHPDDIQNKLNYILFQGILSENNPSYHFPQENLDFLYDHFLATEIWGMEELIVLGNLYRFFDFSILEAFIEEILNCHYYYEVRSYINVIESLLLNVIELTIEKTLFEKSKYYIMKLEPLLKGEHKAYHRIILMYQKGFLRFSLGEKLGKDIMRDAIKCFEITESTYHATYFKNHFQKWTNVDL